MSHLLHSRRIPSSVETPATFAVLFLLVLTPLSARAQAPPATVAELGAHIANLSSLDFPTRMNAARMIRRAPPAEAGLEDGYGMSYARALEEFRPH